MFVQLRLRLCERDALLQTTEREKNHRATLVEVVAFTGDRGQQLCRFFAAETRSREAGHR